MKQLNFLVLLVFMVWGVSCTDPIHNDDPVDTSYSTGFPLDQFHRFGETGDTAAQRKLVNRYRKQLTTNVVNHYPDIQDEKSIKFVLGSGFAEDVLTGSGKTNSGEFNNELIIIINDSLISDTVFLACGNGMLSPLILRTSSDFGTAEKWRFTIQKGEGLATYLPQLRNWGRVANDLKIPIKDENGNIVSQETYLNYLGKYQSLLFEGDVIDLIEGKVYNKSGQEVDFECRQAETKKANIENAKAEAKKKSRAYAKRNRKKGRNCSPSDLLTYLDCSSNSRAVF